MERPSQPRILLWREPEVNPTSAGASLRMPTLQAAFATDAQQAALTRRGPQGAYQDPCGVCGPLGKRLSCLPVDPLTQRWAPSPGTLAKLMLDLVRGCLVL